MTRKTHRSKSHKRHTRKRGGKRVTLHCEMKNNNNAGVLGLFAPKNATKPEPSPQIARYVAERRAEMAAAKIAKKAEKEAEKEAKKAEKLAARRAREMEQAKVNNTDMVYPWNHKGKRYLQIPRTGETWATQPDGSIGEWVGLYNKATNSININAPEPEYNLE